LFEEEAKVKTSQHRNLERHTDGDFVEFFRAGKRIKGVFQCVSCQQTVITCDLLRPCQSCGEKLWERADWSPFSRA
jgi:predicted nucleic acid binding AN1-type Zn finger protein